MLLVDILVGLAGAAIVGSSLRDLFQSVVVPRSIGGRWRPSVIIVRYGWLVWRSVVMRIDDAERREDTLGIFAPLFLVALLAYWVASEIVGLGLIFWALRTGIHPQPGLFDAIYFSGASLLTIGYGDFAPVSPAARFLSLFAAATGLGSFAIVTTFLFQTFAAFQRRESFVVTVSERTGSPPSGLELILRHARLGLMSDLSPVLRESQRWIAEVMETHLAYPVLSFFRSSHDDESWVGTLGALLDASTLLMTTVDLESRGQAELTAHLGIHLVRDFNHFFRYPVDDASGVEFEEFTSAYQALREAGLPLHPLDDAWPAFSRKRAVYATPLNSMAHWWRIPPARWIGDRSRVRIHVNAGIT